MLFNNPYSFGIDWSACHQTIIITVDFSTENTQSDTKFECSTLTHMLCDYCSRVFFVNVDELCLLVVECLWIWIWIDRNKWNIFRIKFHHAHIIVTKRHTRKNAPINCGYSAESRKRNSVCFSPVFYWCENSMLRKPCGIACEKPATRHSNATVTIYKLHSQPKMYERSVATVLYFQQNICTNISSK